MTSHGISDNFWGMITYFDVEDPRHFFQSNLNFRRKLNTNISSRPSKLFISHIFIILSPPALDRRFQFATALKRKHDIVMFAYRLMFFNWAWKSSDLDFSEPINCWLGKWRKKQLLQKFFAFKFRFLFLVLILRKNSVKGLLPRSPT
jgi:hypothetical protein